MMRSVATALFALGLALNVSAVPAVAETAESPVPQLEDLVDEELDDLPVTWLEFLPEIQQTQSSHNGDECSAVVDITCTCPGEGTWGCAPGTKCTIYVQGICIVDLQLVG